MRRIIALILISISCLSLAACAAKTYRLPWYQFCSKGMDIIELEAKDKKDNMLNEIVDDENIDFCKNILNNYKDKMIISVINNTVSDYCIARINA